MSASLVSGRAHPLRPAGWVQVSTATAGLLWNLLGVVARTGGVGVAKAEAALDHAQGNAEQGDVKQAFAGGRTYPEVGGQAQRHQQYAAAQPATDQYQQGDQGALQHPAELDRNLLNVAWTHVMHRLVLPHTEAPSPWLPEAPESGPEYIEPR